MRKIKIDKFDEDRYSLNNIFSTRYDSLFKDDIRERGTSYSTSNLIDHIYKSKNIISCVVSGSRLYNVSIEFLDNDEIKVKCDCDYHKSTDIYCKHVYALLLTLKLLYEKECMLAQYNKNIKKIKELDVLIKEKYLANKKYLNVLTNTVSLDNNNKYLDYIKKLNDFTDTKNIYKIRSLLKYSYEYLKYTTEDYNYLVNKIEEGKKEIEKIKNKNKLKIIDDNKDEEHSLVVDDALEEILDNYIAEFPLPILEMARDKNIECGDSTEIIDKAINERKQRDEIIRKELLKQQSIQEEITRKNKKIVRRAVFLGFLSKTFDILNSNNSKSHNTDYLMPWEQDLVDNGEYEPYHFEEEEMEEDDFYYEDD